MMLSEVSDSASVIQSRSTRHGLDRSGKQFDKGGFTRSVRADDGDTAVELNVDIDVFENSLFGRIAKSDFVELKQWRRNLFRVGELERFVIVRFGRFKLWELFKDFDS